MAACEEIGPIKRGHEGDDEDNEKRRSSSDEEEESPRSSSGYESLRSSAEDENLKSSSEDEKLRSSSEDEKLISSSEEDEKRRSGEFEVKKRASTNEEANFQIKRAKIYVPVEDSPIGQVTVYDSESEMENSGKENSETESSETDSSEAENSEAENDSDEYEDDELSEFSREEVESTPVKSEEIKVELTDVEKWYFLGIGSSEVEKNRICVWKPTVKRHIPTIDELVAINREILANEFDVPYFTWPGGVGVHRANLTIESYATHICQCAKVALKFYNMKNGTKYDFERLVKCMTRPCAIKVYCITFKAKEDGPTVTFQAKTWVKNTYDVHIMMCRIEPCDNAQPLLEAEKVRECDQAISTN